MEEELKAIKKLGVATSAEVGELVDKNIRNVIKGLKQLEIYGEVKIIVFQSFKQKKRIYIENELYDNFNKVSE